MEKVRSFLIPVSALLRDHVAAAFALLILTGSAGVAGLAVALEEALAVAF